MLLLTNFVYMKSKNLYEFFHVKKQKNKNSIAWHSFTYWNLIGFYSCFAFAYCNLIGWFTHLLFFFFNTLHCIFTFLLLFLLMFFFSFYKYSLQLHFDALLLIAFICFLSHLFTSWIINAAFYIDFTSRIRFS